MDLHKISKIIALAIGAISIVFTIICMSTDVTSESFTIDLFIYVAYAALLITIGIVLYYVANQFSHQKDKKKTLISIGAFLGTILVAFIFADGTAVPLKDGGEISSGFSKFISTSLNTFYIIGLASLATLVYSSFGKLKK